MIRTYGCLSLKMSGKSKQGGTQTIFPVRHPCSLQVRKKSVSKKGGSRKEWKRVRRTQVRTKKGLELRAVALIMINVKGGEKHHKRAKDCGSGKGGEIRANASLCI